MSASCCGFMRRNAAVVLLSPPLLLVIAVVAIWVRDMTKMGVVECPEIVQVLVAAKDLTTGTAFTKDNVDELTTFGDFPRSVIPEGAKLILKKEELIGKRLSRATHQGEYFNVADVGIKTQILFDPTKDIMSLPISAKTAGAADIGPGSRVDLIASYRDGFERHAFTLLPDMLVLAVNLPADLCRKPLEPDIPMVSFYIDQKQALLVTLANQASCHLEVHSRRPDAPKRKCDYDKTLARLQELKKRQDVPPEVAPDPRPVGR